MDNYITASAHDVAQKKIVLGMPGNITTQPAGQRQHQHSWTGPEVIDKSVHEHLQDKGTCGAPRFLRSDTSSSAEFTISGSGSIQRILSPGANTAVALGWNMC